MTTSFTAWNGWLPTGLIGMPSWLELVVIGLAVLVVLGPKLLNFLARLSAERERYR